MTKITSLFTRILKVAAYTALTATAWLLIFYLALSISPAMHPRPLWTASSGKTVPPAFLFVMYPAHDAVPLYDHPGANKVGTLTRAVANSRHELDTNGQGWIEVRIPGEGGSRWVQLADLRFEQPPNAKVDYFEAYAKANPSIYHNEFAAASLSKKSSGDGAQSFTFRRDPDDDHVEEYVYRVRAGIPEPLEMYTYFGPGLALSSLPWFFGAMLAAALAAVAALLLARRYFKKQKPTT